MKNTQTYEEVYRVYYPKVMGYMHSKISSSYEAEDLASMKRRILPPRSS